MNIDILQKEVSIDYYVKNYVNVDKFLKCCQACDAYSKKWSCPPFDFDPLDYWKQFKTLKLYGNKISFNDKEAENWYENLDRVKEIMSLALISEERKIPGSVSLCAGSCTWCPKNECTRSSGLPCKHPEKLRYSIEALGGDVSSTTKDILGVDILWPKDNKIPEYFVLVAGMLYK